MGDETKAGPEEPTSQLLQEAITMHEVFLTFLEAGFSERQALYLVGHAMFNRTEGESQ